MSEYVCDESVGEVWHNPLPGDLLCFDGKEWKVARRNGWHYPVDTEESPAEEAEKQPKSD